MIILYHKSLPDMQAPLERVGKKRTGIEIGKATVTDLAQMVRAADGGVETNLYNGLADRHGNDLGLGSWEELVAAIPKGQEAAFQDYLLHKHNSKASAFLQNEPDNERHPGSVGGWNKYKTTFEVGGKYFKGEISVQVTERGRVFHDVTKIQNITDSIDGLSVYPDAISTSDVSTHNITRTDRNGNSDFSGQADIGLDFDEMIRQYGVIPVETNPERNIQFPRQISDELKSTVTQENAQLTLDRHAIAFVGQLDAEVAQETGQEMIPD